MGKGSKKRRHPRKKKPGKGPAQPRRPLNPVPRAADSPSPLKTALSVGFFVLVLGLVPFLYSDYMLAGALGLVGHPAVFTATSCAMTGTGKDRHIACGGNLAAAHRPPRYASIDAQVPLNRATPVQALPTGSLETVGPAAVSGWSTLGMGGITVLTAGALAAFRKRLKPPARRTGFRVLLVPGSLTLAGLVVYVVVRAVM
ncbi:hypothetical protein [Streptomyces fulvoviolaceus]|uniref:hypothetical protein n=1 Tax=Streptomyces fulvoviolaceus TaxID=285535 RepID=UPI0004CAB186|nr:hypothetical protein [Streptomyces fulvoviolaceus]MCT9082267.1 hypothetical protein [Streptomyces fulvoviolaceus]